MLMLDQVCARENLLTNSVNSTVVSGNNRDNKVNHLEGGIIIIDFRGKGNPSLTKG